MLLHFLISITESVLIEPTPYIFPKLDLKKIKCANKKAGYVQLNIPYSGCILNVHVSVNISSMRLLLLDRVSLLETAMTLTCLKRISEGSYLHIFMNLFIFNAYILFYCVYTVTYCHYTRDFQCVVVVFKLVE